MSTPKTDHLKEQAEEISSIVQQSGLSFEQFASRLLIQPDTLRKYAKGYAACSDRLRQSIRQLGDAVSPGAVIRTALQRGRAETMISSVSEESPPPYGGGDAVIEVLRVLFRAQDDSQLSISLNALLNSNLPTNLRKKAVTELTRQIQERLE